MRPPSPRDGRFNAAVLLAIIAVASLQYVGELGTYTDSWNFVANMVTSVDQSWSGLYGSLAREPNVAVRPPQIVWYIIFHKLWPGDIQAANVASHVLFGVAILTLYAVMRRLPATREGAFAITLLYACAPHYIAVRMWHAAHQAVLALLFFAFTLLLVAIYSERGQDGRRHWLLGAILLSSALSCLAYEMFSFVLLAVPLFVWWARGQAPPGAVRDRALQLATLAIVVPVAAASLYKISFEYAFSLPQRGADLPTFAHAVAAMYARIAVTEFGTAGLLAPRAVVGLATGPYFDPRAVAAVAICAVLLAARGWRRWLPAAPADAAPARRDWFLGLSGLAVFVLAYVPLTANFFYGRAPFGETSRIHIAGALGVVLVLYAGFHAIERRRRGLGAALLAIYCLAGIFIQVSVGRMWTEAYVEQNRRYAAMKLATGTLSERDTVLLYGACPYHGAAPVLYTSWGLSGRLRADPEVAASRGDVLNAATRLDRDALVTVVYAVEQRYAYQGLVVFDISTGTATRVDSYGEARRFFADHPLSRAAPCRYVEGGGTNIYGL